MERHAEMGAELLAGSRSDLVQLGEVIARTHHERWDGTGYPAGLAGEDIPLAGRICAICDVFDALVSSRPYKPPGPSARRWTRSAPRAAGTSTRGSSSCSSELSIDLEADEEAPERHRGGRLTLV